MSRKKALPDDRVWGPDQKAVWVPTGTDRATLDGMEQQVDDSLDAWLAAGGERRKRPRGPQWDPTEPMGLDPLGADTPGDKDA